MHYLLYSGPTSETGKTLKERLNIPGGTTAPTKPVDCLIRWGSTVGVANRPKRILNKKAAVELATDKLASLQLLTKAGVNCPAIVGAAAAEAAKGKITVPSLGRRIHHSQGTDIILCLQARDVRRAIRRGSNYFVEYISTDREYRVHVFNGNVIRISQKLLKDGEESVPFIRNLENGYVYGTPRKDLKDDQIQQAVQAVKTLNLDFGAVDLIIADTGKAYVLEVNTGPSLVESGLDIYINEFQKILNAKIS